MVCRQICSDRQHLLTIVINGDAPACTVGESNNIFIFVSSADEPCCYSSLRSSGTFDLEEKMIWRLGKATIVDGSAGGDGFLRHPSLESSDQIRIVVIYIDDGFGLPINEADNGFVSSLDLPSIHVDLLIKEKKSVVEMEWVTEGVITAGPSLLPMRNRPTTHYRQSQRPTITDLIRPHGL
ncbi:hypothetical protein ACLOJK_041210 [Asimina triloba]